MNLSVVDFVDPRRPLVKFTNQKSSNRPSWRKTWVVTQTPKIFTCSKYEMGVKIKCHKIFWKKQLSGIRKRASSVLLGWKLFFVVFLVFSYFWVSLSVVAQKKKTRGENLRNRKYCPGFTFPPFSLKCTNPFRPLLSMTFHITLYFYITIFSFSLRDNRCYNTRYWTSVIKEHLSKEFRVRQLFSYNYTSWYLVVVDSYGEEIQPTLTKKDWIYDLYRRLY